MHAIRLPRDIEARLGRLARRTGRSKSHYAREAILEYLEDLEDYYLAEERVKSFRDAGTISLDDMIRKHGVAG